MPGRVPGSATWRGGPVASNREDRNRVFGMPRGTEPYAREGEEPQRALGVPVDWYGPADRDWFRSLIHPIKGYKRWAQRRRAGGPENLVTWLRDHGARTAEQAS